MNKANNNKVLKLNAVKKLHFAEKRRGKGYAMNRRCVPEGILAGQKFADYVGVPYCVIKKIMAGIVEVIRSGNEAVLGERECGVRFMAMSKTDYKTLYIAAQTQGEFRRAIEDMSADWRKLSTGEIVCDTDDEESVKAHVKSVRNRIVCDKREKICVKPDTMVTCPKCGNEFRVGRYFAN